MATIADMVVEGTEDYSVNLSGPGSGIGAGGGVTTQIIDDDATRLQWGLTGTTQLGEGDVATYSVSYSGATLKTGVTATVTLATSTGTATEGADFTSIDGTVLTFSGGGVTNQTVSLQTTQDTDIEGAEDYTVSMTASIGMAAATITTQILDDDETLSFSPLGVEFDGSTNAHTGATIRGFASSQGTISVWLNSTESDWRFFSIKNDAGDEVDFRTGGGGVLTLFLRDASGNNLQYWWDLSAAFDGDWHWIAVNYDTNAAAGLKTANCVVDGSPASPVFQGDSSGPFTIAWDSFTDFWLASHFDGVFKANGSWSELLFKIGTNLDVTSPTNQPKFYGGGHPADVGFDGSTPFGATPDLYLSVRSGDSASDFLTNRGTGGDFSISEGSLSLSSNNP